MISKQWIDLSYLAAAVLFIFALKAMSSPKTARRGNMIGAVGMLIAIVFTLMSGSNAISGITIIGALLAAGSRGWAAGIFGMLAVAAAMINVVGGYMVTDRMLAMFRGKREGQK